MLLHSCRDHKRPSSDGADAVDRGRRELPARTHERWGRTQEPWRPERMEQLLPPGSEWTPSGGRLRSLRSRRRRARLWVKTSAV